jgi:hypothetical protein
MNVRLKKRFDVMAGMVYDDQFATNRYQIDLELLTVSDDHEQQNIAYDRMKFWVYRLLQDGILMSEDSEMLEKWADTGSRIMALPEEPVDQVVGIMLYLKLNAVMENRMVVTTVEISSTEGDDTVYVHNHGEALGSLAENGWWTDARPCWILPQTNRNHGKIVTLDRTPEWGDFDLDWNKKDQDKKDTVVFADFRRDADE